MGLQRIGAIRCFDAPKPNMRAVSLVDGRGVEEVSLATGADFPA
jgi:hypothetical protein